MINSRAYWRKKIRPCPFCGKIPEINEVNTGRTEYFLSCRSSNCIEQRHVYSSLRAAIEQWNRRKGEKDDE